MTALHKQLRGGPLGHGGGRNRVLRPEGFSEIVEVGSRTSAWKDSRPLPTKQRGPRRLRVLENCNEFD